MRELVIRIPRKTLAGHLLSISIVLSMLFAYSRLSWGIFIPSTVWGAVLCLSIALALASVIIDRKKSHITRTNILSYILFLMIVIMCIWNNYDLKTGDFLSIMLPYITMLALYVCCSKNREWIGTAVTVMIAVGLLNTFITLMCSANNSLYYKLILPIMSRYGTSYTPHPSAGFTAHYSTNGIYLALGFSACSTIVYMGQKRHGVSLLLSLLLISISLLICGKRGVVLCLAIAFFVCYRNYTVSHKRGRVYRVLLILLICMCLLYIVSLFVPSVMYIFERMTNEQSKGDISNGRFVLWYYAWEQFLMNPFLGKGWRWFMHTNMIFVNADAHNCYLQLLTETGIVGSISFYMFFAVSAFRAYKLSIAARRRTIIVSSIAERHIYIALMNIVYMTLFMFEGTALYMPECMFTYFLSCSIIEAYRSNS